MYKLVRNDWNLALHEFSHKLIQLLGDNLVMIIGLEEDSRVYDSNVLVVVKALDDEVRRLIAKSALEVNDKHECTISYYIAKNSDKNVIELFSNVQGKVREDCEEAFREFHDKVGHHVSDMVFIGDRYIYDSNTLIIVDKLTEDVKRLIAKSALEVNDKHECTISYYIATPSDEGLINEFKKIRETIK
ncbi:hypothetical protein B9Q04_19165 [Candidatus Marsarchaeota G2 archaeon BE_D]|uniref:Uncharacterized protein n=1 Tax=Candidatus Marsarchaeota G2 archaeon BE_D TaxID=1978158 RepID=A0A2R6C295_9ARCH|nr:MAG: hypothetical protein B9Q04_19165 [Candidatus Marsarchaeota G2 archaeon BE_D]